MRVVVHDSINYLTPGASLVQAHQIIKTLLADIEVSYGVRPAVLLRRPGRVSDKLRAARRDFFRAVVRLLDGDRALAAELLSWLMPLPQLGIERRLDEALR